VGKTYCFETLVKMHKLMKEIEKHRMLLEDEYIKTGSISPSLLHTEQKIDAMVVEYMLLAQEASV